MSARGRLLGIGVGTSIAIALGVLAGCGSSSSGPTVPTVSAARTYQLAGFQPAAAVPAARPIPVALTIEQPSGAPLTQFKTGSGPHTGIHLIIVRDDLGVIIHHHPPIGVGGRLNDSVTFPSPGRYRIILDVYPKQDVAGLANFQLFRTITVSGRHAAQPLPAFQASEVVDGYRVTMSRKPTLRAVEPAFLTVRVTDASGRPAAFTPWYGALAHAIFFRAGSLDYFHTHVCGPGAAGCTSVLGGSKVMGVSTTPGQLRVGVLLPVPGTWRLFLQCKIRGHVVTAPFTLQVRE